MAYEYAPFSPYNYVLNNPISLIDPDGRMPIEPARNQAGTIQQAIHQWRSEGLTSLEGIQGFVRNKDIDDRGTAAIRYVYTENNGWIDLSHYILVQEKGEFLTNSLEPLSGNKILQDLFLGEDADRSFYSYEDLPSNAFSAEVELQGFEGDKLFEAIEEHFSLAKATSPEEAPNYRQIPFDDHDRSRLPDIKSAKMVYSPMHKSKMPRIKYYSKEEKIKLTRSGNYVPQNHTSKPYDLNNFGAANTSLEKQ